MAKGCKCCQNLFLILFVALTFIWIMPTPRDLQVKPFDPPPIKSLEQYSVKLDLLDKAEQIDIKKLGCEDVEVDSQGFAYTGTYDGTILKINLESKQISEIAYLNGTNYGLAMSPDQTKLAIASQFSGLVLLDIKNGQWRTLVEQEQGQKFKAFNSITFKTNTLLYYTVSGHIPMRIFQQELLYRTNSGKVFSYNLQTSKNQLVIDGIMFANGIAYSKKDNALYAVELNNHRLLKYSLNQNDYLQPKVVMTLAHAFFDNLKINEDGMIWAANPSLRDHVTNLLDRSTIIRRILLNVRLPPWLFMSLTNQKYCGGIQIDPSTGSITKFLYTSSKKISFVTSINEKNGKVFISSLFNRKFLMIDKDLIEDQVRPTATNEEL